MRNDVIVGIDPGQKGGLTLIMLSVDGRPLKVRSIPYDIDCYLEELKLAKSQGVSPVVIIEQVHSMPRQGVASTFKFGELYGVLKGLCRALDLEYHTVPPQAWKRHYGLLHKDKDDSIALAKSLYPSVNLFATPRCRKESDGMAESLLIAEYWRRLKWE